MVTDKEKLLDFIINIMKLKETKSKYLKLNEYSYINNTITIGEGIGYSNFSVIFEFNEDGSFKTHGVWE